MATTHYAADARTVEGPYGFIGNGFAWRLGRSPMPWGSTGPRSRWTPHTRPAWSRCIELARSLHDGESDLAFAGGATVLLDPRNSPPGSAQGMLSVTGRCQCVRRRRGRVRVV